MLAGCIVLGVAPPSQAAPTVLGSAPVPGAALILQHVLVANAGTASRPSPAPPELADSGKQEVSGAWPG